MRISHLRKQWIKIRLKKSASNSLFSGGVLSGVFAIIDVPSGICVRLMHANIRKITRQWMSLDPGFDMVARFSKTAQSISPPGNNLLIRNNTFGAS